MWLKWALEVWCPQDLTPLLAIKYRILQLLSISKCHQIQRYRRQNFFLPECLEHSIKRKENKKDTKIKYAKFHPSPANPKRLDQPPNVFLVLASRKTWSYELMMISALPFSPHVVLAVRIHCWNSKRAYIELYKVLIFKSSRYTEIVGIIRLFW